jgi:hypothetical protein
MNPLTLQTSKGYILVTVNIIIMLLFSVYYTFRLWDKDTRRLYFGVQDPVNEIDFSVPHKIINGVYYSIVTHATLGFGDYFPIANETKGVVLFHVLLVFLLNLFIILS